MQRKTLGGETTLPCQRAPALQVMALSVVAAAAFSVVNTSVISKPPAAWLHGAASSSELLPALQHLAREGALALLLPSALWAALGSHGSSPQPRSAPGFADEPRSEAPEQPAGMDSTTLFMDAPTEKRDSAAAASTCDDISHAFRRWRPALLSAWWDREWAQQALATCCVAFPLADPCLHALWGPLATVSMPRRWPMCCWPVRAGVVLAVDCTHSLTLAGSAPRHEQCVP